MECISNRWADLPVVDLINLYNKNSSLNYGTAQESSSRLEIILHALISMIDAVDADDINRCSRVKPNKKISPQPEELNSIASSIQERSFSGLQAWEKALFDEHIRPLRCLNRHNLYNQTPKT